MRLTTFRVIERDRGIRKVMGMPKILVVDDEKNILELLRFNLNRKDMR